MSRILLAALLIAGCSGGSASQKEAEARNRCLLAKFMEDPNALTICSDDCEAQNGEACTTLGLMYEQGHMVPEQSREQALVFVDRGCALGDAVGCLRAGEYRDASSDLTVRTTSFQKACDADAKGITREDQRIACAETASAYLAGTGVAPDEAMAQAYAQKACELGNFEACEGQLPPPPNDRQPVTDAPLVDLSFGEVDADGLKLRDMSCQIAGGGMMTGVLLVGLLSKHKPALDACGASNDAQLSWTAGGGVMTEASATGNNEAVNACLADAVRAVSSAPDGTCSATLPAN